MQNNPFQDNAERLKQNIRSIDSEIELLTDEKNMAWKSIQDMTVSANVADATFKRMEAMTRDIRKLKGDRKRLLKQLYDETGQDSY